MITNADKPKDARGIESQVWDILIEASRENIIGTKHNTYVELRIASSIIARENLGQNVREALESVYREYRSSINRLRVND